MYIHTLPISKGIASRQHVVPPQSITSLWRTKWPRRAHLAGLQLGMPCWFFFPSPLGINFSYSTAKSPTPFRVEWKCFCTAEKMTVETKPDWAQSNLFPSRLDVGKLRRGISRTFPIPLSPCPLQTWWTQAQRWSCLAPVGMRRPLALRGHLQQGLW